MVDADREEGSHATYPPIKIGDKVKAGFLTGSEATHTCLDIYWELL